jgi:hypothetical protein
MIRRKPLDILGFGGFMRLVVRIAVLSSVIAVLVGCGSTVLRLPANYNPKFNSKITSSLKTAAANGVLFQVQDSVFRDLPSRQVELCRASEAPTWSQALTQFLDLMDHNPQFYNKFYIVDFKKGDNKSKVEITTDIDGLSYLNITYAKRENHEKVTTLTTMPCADTTSQHLGKDLVTTSIDWPTKEEITAALRAAPDKTKVDRFHFNTDFLTYLAERQAILKIDPEVAFERTYQGDYFLTTWLEKMSKEIKEPTTNLEYMNYWLSQILEKSSQAKPVQFFGLRSQGRGTFGIKVDTVGKMARQVAGYQEPTYLFMSYREKGGDYIYSSLKDMNMCMQKFWGIYRSISSTYENDPNGFLAPGYELCRMAGEE